MTTYQNISDSAKALSDSRYDAKNSQPEDILLFLNIELESLYRKKIEYQVEEVTKVAPVAVVNVRASDGSDGSYVTIPDDLSTLIGFSFHNEQNLSYYTNNQNITERDNRFYFDSGNININYIAYTIVYTDVDDLETVVPKWVKNNITYIQYALAIRFASSARDMEKVAELKQEMKDNDIHEKVLTEAFVI